MLRGLFAADQNRYKKELPGIIVKPSGAFESKTLYIVRSFYYLIYAGFKFHFFPPYLKFADITPQLPGELHVLRVINLHIKNPDASVLKSCFQHRGELLRLSYFDPFCSKAFRKHGKIRI